MKAATAAGALVAALAFLSLQGSSRPTVQPPASSTPASNCLKVIFSTCLGCWTEIETWCQSFPDGCIEKCITGI